MFFFWVFDYCGGGFFGVAWVWLLKWWWFSGGCGGGWLVSLSSPVVCS